MVVKEVRKLIKKSFRFCLLLSTLCLVISCSKSRFVVQQHNRLVENICTDGQTKYQSNHYIRYKDVKSNSIVDSCVPDAKLKKLDELVVNNQYSYPHCQFEVTYDYLLNLRNYVEENNEKLTKKLIPLSERQYHDTIYYHNSIYFDTLNPW